MDVYGKITLDAETGGFRCKAASEIHRRKIRTMFKNIAPGGRFSHDGGLLRFDIKTALAIRSGRDLPFAWSPEAASFIDNFAANYALRTSARRRLQALLDPVEATSALSGYPLIDNLDEHQQVAVAAMTDPLMSGLCLFDEQGVGKTVMAIHAFDRLVELRQSTTLLVFAPKNMLLTWKTDFSRFVGDKYKIEIVTGDRRNKRHKLLTAADVYVTNYETAHLMEDSLRALILRNHGRLVMVVDESFFVKNAQTDRGKAVRRLRNFVNRCWVLCGTPAPNEALDVVHQFDVADCGVTFNSVALPNDPQELRFTIQDLVEKRGLYLRRLKRDVFPDLPKKNFETVSVPMEPIQRELYTKALSGLIAQVEASDESAFRKALPSFLAKRMSLFEICSHPRQLNANYDKVPGKHIALDRLLHELIDERGEKVVLWSYFRFSIDELVSRYKRFGVVRVDGSVASAEARGAAVAQFQTDPNAKLFIGNPAAAGAGITLTASRVAVYESFPVQTAHYLQSIDRIHRRGQSRNTHYYFLLCEQTLEEHEYLRLLEKERRGFELFGDPNPDTVTREFFLRELQSALRRL